MRRDMAKVVTESPRRGHGIGRNERNTWSATRQRLRGHHIDVDDQPWDDWDTTVTTGAHRVGTMRHVKESGQDTKDFSDLLGPLRGYLRKQVGRRWDDVYSELSATLDRRGVSGSHIWDHVCGRNGEVQLHAYLGRDGNVYGPFARFYPRTAAPIEGLFVHPVTGRLCYVPERRHRWVDPAAEERRRNTREVSATQKLERVDGLWYLVEYRLLDPNEIVKYREDRHTGLPVPVRRCEVRGAAMSEVVRRRQIGRRDKALWKLAQTDIRR